MQTEPTPPRTLTALPPRRGGWQQTLWVALAILMVAGCLVALAVYTAPPLLSDWQVRGAAAPVAEGRIVKGSCSTKVVIAICDLTVSHETPAGPVSRSVNYVFTDVHFGAYSAAVMADPARPALVTTDLGLDKLWNRTLTFLVAAVFLLGCITLPLVAIIRNRRVAQAG